MMNETTPTPNGSVRITTSRASDGHRSVRVIGELDLLGRASFVELCSMSADEVVDVDLSGLSFMDCSGYGALVAGRRSVLAHGGTLVVSNVVGQPAWLMRTLERLALADPDLSLVRTDTVVSCGAPGGGTG